MRRRCGGGGAEVRRFCATCALACARCVFGHLGSSVQFSKIALSPARGGPAAYKCRSRLRVVRLFFLTVFEKVLSLARGAHIWPNFALACARCVCALACAAWPFLYSTALSPARRAVLKGCCFSNFQNGALACVRCPNSALGTSVSSLSSPSSSSSSSSSASFIFFYGDTCVL